ncbi:hypothetical protein BH10ACT11_BH10ACT11_02960 [soil metagenome]
MKLPQTTKGRIAAIVAAAVVAFLVLSQLFVPGLGEKAIRDRLTANGGVADVSISAFPAIRLLWGRGDSLKVNGDGLNIDVDQNGDPAVLGNLDRFGDVEIVLDNSEAGPFRIESFVLARHGEGAYSLDARTATSASQLAAYGVDEADLPGAGIVGTILDFTGLGGKDIPVDLDLEMTSDDGRIEVTDGGGTVAGLPTGPLAELITRAIVIKL